MRYYILIGAALLCNGCALFHPQSKVVAPKVTVRQITSSTWITSEGAIFSRFVESTCEGIDCLPSFVEGVELVPTYKFSPPIPPQN